MIDLHTARFYGAKSEPIDSQEVSASKQVGERVWQILSVEHGGVTDEYQVFVDKHGEGEDCLDSDEGASAYLAGVERLGEVHGELTGDSARPLGADQSNTSLVVTDEGDEWILKVFRKLEEGLNPDVELLSEIAECPNVAGVRGYLTRDGKTLAMMQELIRGGRDGFELACDEAARDASFNALARELGEAVMVVHEALAEGFGVESVPGTRIAASLNEHLDELADKASELAEYEDSLRELYSSVANLDSVPVQRIHGDLHLGQTLRTDDRWFLIDFEGEPARPLEQRRLPDCALRDVAGMVRSFGYARAVGGHEETWEGDAVSAFLSGYGVDDAGGASEETVLLAAYIADKAAYEVVYEANNRPDWVDIPLAAIRDIVKK